MTYYVKPKSDAQREMLADLKAIGFSFGKVYLYKDDKSAKGIIIKGFWGIYCTDEDILWIRKVGWDDKLIEEEEWTGITKFTRFMKDYKNFISDIQPDVVPIYDYRVVEKIIGSIKVQFIIPTTGTGYEPVIWRIGQTWEVSLSFEDMDRFQNLFDEVNDTCDIGRMETIL